MIPWQEWDAAAQWALVAFVLTVVLVPLGIYRNRQRKA